MPDDHRRLKTPNGNPEAFVYLGSAQKELWSSVGTTRVTFIILATATISQICQTIIQLSGQYLKKI
jgi:hypothetical protein